MAVVLLTKFATAIRRKVPPLTPIGWLGLALPLTVMMACILGIGPMMQRSIFSALASDAPSIYSAAYQESIAQFPTLFEWLLFSFHWQFLVMATVILCVSLNGVPLKNFTFLMGASSIVTLTIFDVLAAIIERKLEVSSQLANVVANIAGGVLIAILVSSAFALLRMIIPYIRDSKVLFVAVPTILFVGFGVVVSSATYWSLRELYELLPSRFSVVLGPDVTGFYGVPTKPSGPAKGEKQNKRTFNFLPVENTRGSVSVTSGKGSVSSTWRREVGEGQFSVAVQLYGDCLGVKPESFKSSPNFLKQDNVQRVSIDVDDGLTHLNVANAANRHFEYDAEVGSVYWLTKEESGDSLSVTHFSQPKNEFRILSSGQMVISVSAMLFSQAGEKFIASPRTLTIDIDGNVWRLKLGSERLFTKDAKLDCHPLEMAVPEGRISQATSDAIDLTALISITSLPNQSAIYLRPETSLTLRGINGWTSIDGLPPKAFEYGAEGNLGALSARGNISDLQIEDLKLDVKAYEDIVLTGDLSATFIEKGHVMVSGKARALWKSGVRLTRTRWELLATEWQIAFATAFIAFVGFAATWWWQSTKPLLEQDIRHWGKFFRQ